MAVAGKSRRRFYGWHIEEAIQELEQDRGVIVHGDDVRRIADLVPFKLWALPVGRGGHYLCRLEEENIIRGIDA